MSLGLISLYCEDLNQAREFYEDKLGLVVVPQFTGPEFVFLVAGAVGIALRPLSEAPIGAQTSPGSIELSFVVDDVQATRANMLAKGVEITTDIGDVGAGHAFLARDPEGRLLAFAQLNQQVAMGRAQLGM
jgi:catechol 2,3-dioxygenase-like lactoylglutathione lyase family enzyme